MSGLELTFALLALGAGLATFWVCGVIAWRFLRGPRE
jgi:hypothetical protein